MQEETQKIIQRSQPLIEAKQNEFKRGERPDGNVIGVYRSIDYAREKYARNPLAGLGHVDLYDTGSFTRQLFVERKSAKLFSFDSNDDKAPDLFKKYGDANRGLNEKVWQDVQKEYIAPLLTKWIKQQLNR